MSNISHDVQAVLNQMNVSIPAPADFDVAAFRAMLEDPPASPSSIALAAVEETIIPGDESVPARLYRPNLGLDLPAILFIRGGGFIQRGLDSHDEICRRLAAGTGAAVIALDCRPAPEHPYPAAVDDTYAAITYLTNEADALGLDASRIALAGISSGAAIAAGTALRCRDAGGPRVALQVLLTPMLRHRATTGSRQTYGRGDYGLTNALLDWYSDQYAPGAAADDAYCAPLRAADMRDLPLAYIHTAELDHSETTGSTTRNAFATPMSPSTTMTQRDYSTASTSSPPYSHKPMTKWPPRLRRSAGRSSADRPERRRMSGRQFRCRSLNPRSRALALECATSLRGRWRCTASGGDLER